MPGKSKECGEAAAIDRQRALTWAQRLKRVFAIDIESAAAAALSACADISPTFPAPRSRFTRPNDNDRAGSAWMASSICRHPPGFNRPDRFRR
jgi:hypothetical protein